MKKFSILLLTFYPIISFTQIFTPGSGVTDIDGNFYSTIVYPNTQEWMDENLRTTRYSNGSIIPNVTDALQWYNLTTGAWAHYNNDSQNEMIYGKLYNGYSVQDPRNICPTGWHVPDVLDWTILIDYLGGESVAGNKMRITGTQIWGNDPFATNESGFSALPGGERQTNSFVSLGSRAYFWTSTLHAAYLNDLYYRSLTSYQDEIITSDHDHKYYGKSVRCIKNATLGVYEIQTNQKTLVKILNTIGQETTEQPNELLFYIYNDGTVEKKIISN